MAATRSDIERWFKSGVAQGATHLIVVCDTFDWEDFPVYVMPNQDARTTTALHDGHNMEQVMECYNLRMDMEFQLNEHRAFHY